MNVPCEDLDVPFLCSGIKDSLLMQSECKVLDMSWLLSKHMSMIIRCLPWVKFILEPFSCWAYMIISKVMHARLHILLVTDGVSDGVTDLILIDPEKINRRGEIHCSGHAGLLGLARGRSRRSRELHQGHHVDRVSMCHIAEPDSMHCEWP